MRKLLVTVAGFALAITPSFANVITPGNTVTPDVFASNYFSASGTSVVTSISNAPLNNPSSSTFNATFSETVYADASNMFCSGCYTFVYQFTNSASSSDAVERLTAASFGGFSTDVGYLSGSGQAPDSVNRNSQGNVIGFLYSVNNLMPGSTSAKLIIETNAKAITSTGAVSAQDTYPAGAAAVGPASVTPEPVSVGLLGTGLAALGFARWRRKSVK